MLCAKLVGQLNYSLTVIRFDLLLLPLIISSRSNSRTLPPCPAFCLTLNWSLNWPAKSATVGQIIARVDVLLEDVAVLEKPAGDKQIKSNGILFGRLPPKWQRVSRMLSLGHDSNSGSIVAPNFCFSLLPSWRLGRESAFPAYITDQCP